MRRRTSVWTMPRPRRGRGANKFNAQPVVLDGHRFASKHEAARYRDLQVLVRAGEIRDLELQPGYAIVAHGADGRPAPVAKFHADFRYVVVKTGEVVVEDAKSPATRTTAYRLRKKLVEACHQIQIREV